MAELPKDVSNRELLERIVALDNENVRVRAQLRKQADDFTALRADVDNISKALDVYTDWMSDELFQINAFLWPVVNKVFPGFEATLSQIDKIVPPCAADPRADRRRKKKPSRDDKSGK